MFQKLNKIIRNPYTFSMVAKIYGVAVGFLFTIFQSRYLGAEIKGQVATVNSIIGITSIVFGMGIFHAYPYYKRNSTEDVMPIFLKIAVLMLLIYGGIAAAAVCFMHLSIEYSGVMILTPLLVYDGIISYITQVEVPNKRSATDLVIFTAELVMMVLLWLLAKPSLIIGIAIIAAKDVAKAIVFTFWWRKRIFVPSESLKIWIPRLIKFGFFPMLSLLMSTLNYRIDILMLGGKVADAQIGIYSVGVLLAERIWMVPDAMKGVMVSNLTKGKDAGEVAYVIRICNTLCFFIAIAIAALGKPFLDFAFGKQYAGSYQVTLILLFGVFSMIYYRAIAAYNVVMGKQLISFLFLCVGVVTNIIANLFFIPWYGIYGAGIASVVSYAICSLLFIIYFCRTTKISFGNMLFVNKQDVQKLKQRLKRH